jgi:hypothetical protein
MSVIKPPPKMKIFLAAYAKTPELISEGIDRLREAYEDGLLGYPDIVSPDFPMTDTNYYAAEMGEDLLKRYLSFPCHLSPDKIVDIKLVAMEVERGMALKGMRTVNLDPGYIFAGGLVLTTGKFGCHRLYLGRGVWGELTILYQFKGFKALPWSYKDYLKPEIQEYFLLMRRAYFKAEAAPAKGEAKGEGEGVGEG